MNPLNAIPAAAGALSKNIFLAAVPVAKVILTLTVTQVALLALTVLAIALMAYGVYHCITALSKKPEGDAKKELDDSFGIDVLLDPKKQNLSSEEVKKLGIQFMAQIKHVLQIANNDAAEKLANRIEKDDQIPQSVKDGFKQAVQKGILTFLGDGFAEGRIPLNGAISNYIQNQLKLIKDHNLASAFESLKTNLSTEIQSGRLQTSGGYYKQTFGRFFELNKVDFNLLSEQEQNEWIAQLRQIAQHTLLRHEIAKIEQNKNSTPGEYFENLILQKCGYGTTDDLRIRQQRHESEIQVLQALLSSHMFDNEEMEGFQLKIENEKLAARILSSGVPKEEVPHFVKYIRAIQEANKRMNERIAPNATSIPGLSNDHPESSKIKLLNSLKKNLIQGVKAASTKIIDALVKDNSNIIQSMKESSMDTILLRHEELLKQKNYIAKMHQRALKASRFLEKWKHHLKGELIQGLIDPQEVFLEGACHAISLRWLMHEMSNPADTDRLSDPKLYRVTPQDRFIQAQYSVKKGIVAERFRNTITKLSDLIDLDYNEAIKKKLGIKDVKRTQTSDGTAASFRESLLQAASSGEYGLAIIGMTFEGSSGDHSIYCRFDNTNNQFIIGDPNIGILALENEIEFFECFTDLIEWYNHPFKRFTIDHLIPLK